MSADSRIFAVLKKFEEEGKVACRREGRPIIVRKKKNEERSTALVYVIGENNFLCTRPTVEKRTKPDRCEMAYRFYVIAKSMENALSVYATYFEVVLTRENIADLNAQAGTSEPEGRKVNALLGMMEGHLNTKGYKKGEHEKNLRALVTTYFRLMGQSEPNRMTVVLGSCQKNGLECRLERGVKKVGKMTNPRDDTFVIAGQVIRCEKK